MNYLRSIIYDNIETTVKQLKEVRDHNDSLLFKGNTEDERSDFLNHCISVHNLKENLCKSLNNQVAVLQNDYQTGKINYAKFLDFLKPLKELIEFIISNPKFNTEGLEHKKIEELVSRYL